MARDLEKAGGAGVFTRSDWNSVDRALRSIQQEFRRRPYSIAPIRTSPLRTYDPISIAPNPEGSHIPMLLASLSRSAQQGQWTTLQSALRDFGAKSGLFDEIEIVDKGKKESDPFQVGVKRGGRTFNLIDVGYGVSQALPILVDTLRRPSAFETFLIQQPEVHLHPKAQAELGSFFANQADARRRFVIETHSDYLVDRIRMEVRRKLLTPEDVSLLYFERGKSGATIHNLELDANGSITNPPPGFRQFFLKEELDLLGIRRVSHSRCGQSLPNSSCSRAPRLVAAGKLPQELAANDKVRKKLAELDRAGRLRRPDTERLRTVEQRLQTTATSASNDLHVPALAIVSGARTLATDDNALAADFRNKRIIDNPRGKIYRDPAVHGHLLCHTSSCGIATRPR
jgi:hypothetical protein